MAQLKRKPRMRGATFMSSPRRIRVLCLRRQGIQMVDRPTAHQGLSWPADPERRKSRYGSCCLLSVAGVFYDKTRRIIRNAKSDHMAAAPYCVGPRGVAAHGRSLPGFTDRASTDDRRATKPETGDEQRPPLS